MRLNISDIPEEGLQQEFVLPLFINKNAKPDTAYAFIRVLKFGKKVLVEGSLKISASLNCSRCLKGFSYPIDTVFRDEYNPAEEIDKDERELSAGELDLSFYHNNELDIAELIQEQAYLAIPMKPLCSTDCRGMCPTCGKDLNEGACQCKGEDIDPRLAPLKEFKKLMKNRSTPS